MKAFEQSCVIAEDIKNRLFEGEEVDLIQKTGFALHHNFKLWGSKKLADAAQLAEGVDPSDCGSQWEKVKFPSGTVQGYITQDPARNFVDVVRIDEVYVQHKVTKLPAAHMILEGQGKKAWKQAVRNMKSEMPAVLRGKNDVPSLAAITAAGKVRNVGLAKRAFQEQEDGEEDGQKSSRAPDAHQDPGEGGDQDCSSDGSDEDRDIGSGGEKQQSRSVPGSTRAKTIPAPPSPQKTLLKRAKSVVSGLGDCAPLLIHKLLPRNCETAQLD